MDSHDFAISNAAPPPSVQHAVPDDQPNQAGADAFEQLDAARAVDSAYLARRPGRKPPPHVSRPDFNYIHEMMSGVSLLAETVAVDGREVCSNALQGGELPRCDGVRIHPQLRCRNRDQLGTQSA